MPRRTARAAAFAAAVLLTPLAFAETKDAPSPTPTDPPKQEGPAQPKKSFAKKDTGRVRKLNQRREVWVERRRRIGTNSEETVKIHEVNTLDDVVALPLMLAPIPAPVAPKPIESPAKKAALSWL